MTAKLIKDLKAGHSRYKDLHVSDYQPLFKELAEDGQHPKALCIACSDSRVDPALLFDQHPGDLFLVRNVANVMPPYEPNPGHHGTSAAVEYAVRGLQVSDIIVMGHSKCGGVKTLMNMADGAPPIGEFVGRWMSMAQPAVEIAEEAPEEGLDRGVKVEQAVVRLSLKNLMSFPWVAERVAWGSLELHGFYFDMSNGSVMWLNPATDHFEDFA